MSYLGVLCFVFAFVVSLLGESLFDGHWYAYVIVIITTIPVLGLLVLISRQPTSDAKLSFSVPLVPWLPGISILINVYLMIMLDVMTWVRFTVWIIIGLTIYFTYGMKNSVEQTRVKQVHFGNDVKEHDGGEMFTSSKEILVPTGQ